MIERNDEPISGINEMFPCSKSSFTLDELADKLNKSKRTIYRHISKGHLETFKNDHSTRVMRREAIKYVVKMNEKKGKILKKCDTT